MGLNPTPLGGPHPERNTPKEGSHPGGTPFLPGGPLKGTPGAHCAPPALLGQNQLLGCPGGNFPPRGSLPGAPLTRGPKGEGSNRLQRPNLGPPYPAQRNFPPLQPMRPQRWPEPRPRSPNSNPWGPEWRRTSRKVNTAPGKADRASRSLMPRNGANREPPARVRWGYRSTPLNPGRGIPGR